MANFLVESGGVTEAEMPIEIDTLVTQIRTAIERCKVSTAALQSPTPSTSAAASSQYTSMVMQYEEALKEIEDLLPHREKTSHSLNDDEVQKIQIRLEKAEIDVPNEARWQSLPNSTRTHPTSLEPWNYHIEDLKAFREDLLSAKERSQQAPKALYKKVEVLLFTWKDGDKIGPLIKKEVRALTKLFNELNYSLTSFDIPNRDCQNEVQWKVLEFLRAHREDPPGETLFIIYYTGHGSTRNGICYWHPTGAAAELNAAGTGPSGPSIEWSKIQNDNFDSTDQDVLFILDCCYAGAAVLQKGAGHMKEVLAACSSETSTPAGLNSFTHRLIRGIRELVKTKPVFQIAWLYRDLVSRSQDPLPLHVNVNMSSQSIWLSSLAATKKNDKETTAEITDNHLSALPLPIGPSSSSVSGSENEPSIFSGEQDTSDEMTQFSDPDPDLQVPSKWQYKVLLSVKLKENVLPRSADWELHFPHDQVEGLEDVTFQSLYQAKSTLLLLTMPIQQWVLLKDNPAYKFIDFVQGEDEGIRHLHPQKTITPSQEVSRSNTDETTSSNSIDPSDETFRELLAKMKELFKTTSQSANLKVPGIVAKQCQHIAASLGIPSRLESDPRYLVVRDMAQSLIKYYDPKNEYELVGYQYNVNFNMQVMKLYEKSFSQIKNTLKKAEQGGGDIKLENAIENEIENLEKEVDKVAELTRVDGLKIGTSPDDRRGVRRSESKLGTGMGLGPGMGERRVSFNPSTKTTTHSRNEDGEMANRERSESGRLFRFMGRKTSIKSSGPVGARLSPDQNVGRSAGEVGVGGGGEVWGF